mmetsp:Transcript_15025/g.35362  ORF Transcript_15025/g.35362 Transcript_15025/m.35362 type:complete len:317 (+) Transcript_15025:109-1059(+)
MGSTLSLAAAFEPRKVDAMPGFPESLGPFAVLEAPLTKEDIKLQPRWGSAGGVFPLMGTDMSGTAWFFHKDAAEKYRVSRGDASQPATRSVNGLFSPRHPVPLTGPGRRLAKLPDEARTMVWSYPVAGWADLFKGDVPPLVAAFLQVGGFVYMDKECEIVHVQAFMATCEEHKGFTLHFGWPRPVPQGLVRTLVTQKRFQPITIGALWALGARHFCWLRPGEVVESTDEESIKEYNQPHVPHGGFLYLFGDELGEPHPLDRYFPAVFGGSSEVDQATMQVTCSNPLSYFRKPRPWSLKEDSEAPPPTKPNVSVLRM